MSHVKHATIGSLVASLMGAALGFLLWARQLDNNGANRGVMRLIGWMGLGLVTVSVAVACLSIAFLQYVMAREREQGTAESGRARSPASRPHRGLTAHTGPAGAPGRPRFGPCSVLVDEKPLRAARSRPER